MLFVEIEGAGRSGAQPRLSNSMTSARFRLPNPGNGPANNTASSRVEPTMMGTSADSGAASLSNGWCVKVTPSINGIIPIGPRPNTLGTTFFSAASAAAASLCASTC